MIESFLGLAEGSLLTLFISGFISSTLLPGGSELLLGWHLLQQPQLYSSELLWLSVTSGNTLGGILTFMIGWWIAIRYPFRMLDKPQQQRAKSWLEHYGPGALLLSWLPIVGDPLCLLAGWLRLSLLWSLVLILVGKGLRYLLIIFLI